MGKRPGFLFESLREYKAWVNGIYAYVTCHALFQMMTSCTLRDTAKPVDTLVPNAVIAIDRLSRASQKVRHPVRQGKSARVQWIKSFPAGHF